MARLAAGRLDRVERLLDPAAAARRAALLDAARAVYLDADFDPSAAAGVVLAGARERGAEAKAEMEARLEGLDLRPARPSSRCAAPRAAPSGSSCSSRSRSSPPGSATSWSSAPARRARRMHADRLEELREDATPARMPGAEAAAERIRDRWRVLEEFNLQANLMLEALFIELRRALAGAVPAPV